MKWVFNFDRNIETEPATHMKSGIVFHNLEQKYWTVLSPYRVVPLEKEIDHLWWPDEFQSHG